MKPHNKYLNGILAAGTGTSLDECVTSIYDPSDSVSVGMELRLKCLMLLMFTLQSLREIGGKNVAYILIIYHQFILNKKYLQQY